MSHLEHQAIFNVQKNLSSLPIIANKHMQGITVMYPTKQTCVRP